MDWFYLLILYLIELMREDFKKWVKVEFPSLGIQRLEDMHAAYYEGWLRGIEDGYSDGHRHASHDAWKDMIKLLEDKIKGE